ncbi:hypothetical protein BDQ94DRAFT_175549 [Aspergillus welwitschiae]|uniref:Uncharacterized protein n=1 Tax=Aspergillus welwitschiae TaxID=1341132 RepID=A0A3F3PKU5_9EURO|nr:hypothetical protein BDQ94DRAFT_175549 [Aspergillus welwitschiae]RDH27554.1 hypothetical protein BDQ94DRAFT_175549 [Aspergillus welwitschiae]
MAPSSARSSANFSQLPRGPSGRKAKQQNRQSWTDKKLSLLSHLRHQHRWSFKQIQESYFPSRSPSALLGAYWRLSAEDRIRLASRVAALATNAHSNKGQSHLQRNARPPSQSRSNISTSTLSASCSTTGDEPAAIDNSNTNRYNLRPNRPTTSRKRKPRYTVDRVRFPHFFESYSRHLRPSELTDLPDSEYAPPSHTPTPSLSDRSPSVISSLPSPASSLELFGLEARSLNSSDRDSSVTSD